MGGFEEDRVRGSVPSVGRRREGKVRRRRERRRDHVGNSSCFRGSHRGERERKEEASESGREGGGTLAWRRWTLRRTKRGRAAC